MCYDYVMNNIKNQQNKNSERKTILSPPMPQRRLNKERRDALKGSQKFSEKEEQQKEKLQEITKQDREESVAKKAAEIGFAYADLNIVPIDSQALALIKKEEAISANIAVIAKKRDSIKVAIENPDSQEALSILNRLRKRDFKISLFLVSHASLEKAWKEYDGIIAKVKESDEISVDEKDLSDFEKAIKSISELKENATKISVTEALNTIFAGALKMGASDIHLEPSKSSVRLRYRMDGVLHVIAELPLEFYPYAVSRIKMLAELKLNISNIPQDGRLSIHLEDGSMDVRVSSIPGDYGESFVMRLLKQQSISLQFEDLGIQGRALEILKHEIERPNGMILTTGPTGSGKTTTLYAFLNKLNTPEKKIITLEDPIEYRLEGIEQTQIDKEAGYTFAAGLRAILRQDPDVVLVGETRDEETANIAVQAALTGHMVFSTLHTNDAPGAIPRLLNMKIDPTLIGPAVNAFIAQRLVRKLCPKCKQEYAPAKETLEKINKILSIISPSAKVSIPENITSLFKSVGCSDCNQTGYKGRIGIFEVFQVTPEIEKLATRERVATSDIKKAAIKNGMVTMLQDGILKSLRGQTTLEEVYRVTGEEDYITSILEEISPNTIQQ